MARGDGADDVLGRRCFSSKTAPNRMAFIYVPNGKNMADWTPTTEGTGFELTPILEPLAAGERRSTGPDRFNGR